MSFCKAQVLGTVGKDTKVIVSNDKTYLCFSIFVGNGKRSDGSYKESTWFDVTMNYREETQKWMQDRLQVGTQAYVEGKISSRAYINRYNQAVGNMSIFANVVEPIGAPQKEKEILESPYGLTEVAAPATTTAAAPEPPAAPKEELPF